MPFYHHLRSVGTRNDQSLDFRLFRGGLQNRHSARDRWLDKVVWLFNIPVERRGSVNDRTGVSSGLSEHLLHANNSLIECRLLIRQLSRTLQLTFSRSVTMTYSNLSKPLSAYIFLIHSPFSAFRVVPRTAYPSSRRYRQIHDAMNPLAPVTRTERCQRCSQQDSPFEFGAGTGILASWK